MKSIGFWIPLPTLSLICLLSLVAPPALGNERPNILFVISDDQSWMHAGAYGIDRTIKTPGFDRVAREGVLFDHAYCAAPSCAPSRAAILTGRHLWQLEEGGILFGILKPKQYPLFTAQLAQSGYELGITGKGYAPGKILDGGREPLGTVFNQRKLEQQITGINANDYAANFKDFLDARDKQRPFFFWLGTSEPHQNYAVGRWQEQGKKLPQAVLPKCLPDTPTTRGELLDYALEIEHFDRHLVRALEHLENAGLLESTLVIVTSDHGNPMPRSKCNLYDSGTRVPLAVRWPRRILGGRVIHDFVHLPDLAPTILAYADAEVPATIRGKTLTTLLDNIEDGFVDARRDFAVTAFERHIICRRNAEGYPMRCLRTHRWAYIRNYEPERWPAGDPDFNSSHQGFYGDVDKGESKSFLIANAMDPQVRPYFLRAFGRRPAEELYDMTKDPGQLHNLAANPTHAKTLKDLRSRLEDFLRSEDDPRQHGQTPWDNYPFVDQRIFRSPNWETQGYPSPLPGP